MKTTSNGPAFLGNTPCFTSKAGANIDTFFRPNKMFADKILKKIQHFDLQLFKTTINPIVVFGMDGSIASISHSITFSVSFY